MDAQRYLDTLLVQLRRVFGSRLVYLGLQGSVLRGEADERSDIDTMVVLAPLLPEDPAAYRALLQDMNALDGSCGFLCGRAELANWNPLEICQLMHTTRDVYGALAPLLPPWTMQDERNYVKLSLNNLSHALCHRAIYRGPERSAAALPDAYKAAFFCLQNLRFLETGDFLLTRQALLSSPLPAPDRALLETAAALRAHAPTDPDAAWRALFLWCQQALLRT